MSRELRVHSSGDMYTKGGKPVLTAGPPLRAHPLLVLPAFGWDHLPAWASGPHLCESETPCDYCTRRENSQESLSSFSAAHLVSWTSFTHLSPWSPPPVPTRASRRGGEFVTEQSGVCADGDVVSEVRLSESGWEPGGPGLNCAHQQSSGMEPACFYTTLGFPSHHPRRLLC